MPSTREMPISPRVSCPQIVELNHLKEHLQTLLHSCSGDRGGDCGILEHITGTECECCKALHCHLGARDSRKG